LIAKQVEILFSAYRRADYEDPHGFVVQLGAVLEDYPEEVILHVTSPKTGIQRRLKWPPSLAEIVEECDKALEPILRAEERERDWAESKHHATLRALPAPPAPPKMTLEEIEARLGRKLGGIAKRIEDAPLPRRETDHARKALSDLEARKLARTICSADPPLGG
jgi:hypothetical protein